MRAVNLIPSDDRRGGVRSPGKSGAGAYIALGVLGVLVIMVGLFTITNKSLKDKKAQVASAEQAAVAAEARATALTSYATFASLRQKRVDTVKQLASSRFDWSHSLHELSRVLPDNAWLTTVSGTVSPTTSVSGGGGGGLRSALAVPALQISGCTTSQASVAKMLARMRLIDGVQRVSLQASVKPADPGQTGAGGAGAAAQGSCGDSVHFPKFDLVVFYDPQAMPSTASATTTPVASTTAATTAPATGTTAAAGATATTATTATTPAAGTATTTATTGTTTP